eukprot:351009-Chlamydomonas_euryale.AAC.5
MTILVCNVAETAMAACVLPRAVGLSVVHIITVPTECMDADRHPTRMAWASHAWHCHGHAGP